MYNLPTTSSTTTSASVPTLSLNARFDELLSLGLSLTPALICGSAIEAGYIHSLPAWVRSGAGRTEKYVIRHHGTENTSHALATKGVKVAAWALITINSFAIIRCSYVDPERVNNCCPKGLPC